LFESIFSSLIDAVFLVSRDLKIVQGNPAAEEILRQSQDSLVGQLCSEIFPNQPHVIDKIEQTLSSGASYRDLECQALKKSDHSLFPACLTVSPFRDRPGEISGALILLKDMSLLKELEENSRKLESLSSLETLALRMAHEIRNPLGGIRGSAQLLLQELKEDSQREYLDVVISEVDRINRMVEQMMLFTHPRPLKLQLTNIHKVLADIIVLERESLNQRKNIIEQRYDPSLPLIDADEDQLKQVFLNLIKNALEASGENGRIQLLTRVNSGYGIKPFANSSPRNGIVVEIVDSGVGMDADGLKNLFTPFYTTKKHGSGLGLPVSLKIIENHKGKIKITSEKGLGTTAQVILPVQQR
jgi:two-component system nitrogen regulation sensor histidine kinase GlnL